MYKMGIENPDVAAPGFSHSHTYWILVIRLPTGIIAYANLACNILSKKFYSLQILFLLLMCPAPICPPCALLRPEFIHSLTLLFLRQWSGRFQFIWLLRIMVIRRPLALEPPTVAQRGQDGICYIFPVQPKHEVLLICPLSVRRIVWSQLCRTGLHEFCL